MASKTRLQRGEGGSALRKADNEPLASVRGLPFSMEMILARSSMWSIMRSYSFRSRSDRVYDVQRASKAWLALPALKGVLLSLDGSFLRNNNP
jgi:hypothetical protein